MAKVIVSLAVSLDGYIAGANDGPDQPLGDGGGALFDWYFSGGDTPSRHYKSFKMSSASAEIFDEEVENCGAVVSGRRTYDIANAWGGDGPVPGIPLFVLTHDVPVDAPQGEIPYTFVTDGVESVIEKAKRIAGDKTVSLAGASIAQQCLRLGLLDEIELHLVPVLLGGGVRLLDHFGTENIELERIRVVEAPEGVTHLRYRVKKP